MKFRPAFNPFSRQAHRTKIVLALAGALALGSTASGNGGGTPPSSTRPSGGR